MVEQLADEIKTVERHMVILRLVLEEEPIGIVSMSNETDIPHHKVRYSLRILEEEGLIEPTDRGAVSTKQAEEFLENQAEGIDKLIERIDGLRIDQQSPA